MTHLCVSIFVGEVSRAKRDIAAAAEAGADMVELRLDRLESAADVRRLVHECILPCIVTCRPTWEGGQCALPEPERMQLLRESAQTDATYIDIEWKASSQALLWNQPREVRPGLIVSIHDFTGRPARLYQMVTQLNESDSDVNKIVWHARSIRDNLEAFELIRSRQKPTIALCMGEAGLISRVLAKKFGAFLTFASLGDESATAPGQVSIQEMKRLYRWDALGPETNVYGVVGKPVAHSMSPAMHNAAFERAGYDGVYLPLLVNEGYESFKAFMESFVNFDGLDLAGLSVTLPHKENALRYLKEKGAAVEELAERIGAVNTISISDEATKGMVTSRDREGAGEQSDEATKGSGSGDCPRPRRSDGERGGSPGLRGMNTDYAAILDSVTAKLGIGREQLKDYRVAVLGAGGTGRTAVAALAHYGATVVIYNRTKQRADVLAEEFNGRSGKVVAARMEKLCDSCCHIYINTTSVGMHPRVEASPLGDRPPKFTPETLVFDTIYNPLRTKLLQEAESAGAKTIGGIEMFVRQGARQFEAWTGREAPVEVMREVVQRRLVGG